MPSVEVRKVIIYGSGLVVISFIVGLLLYLTFDNIASGQAVYGTRQSTFRITGPESILVNLGVIGLVCSLVSFIMHLISRKSILLTAYRVSFFTSIILILSGLALNAS